MARINLKELLGQNKKKGQESMENENTENERTESEEEGPGSKTWRENGSKTWEKRIKELEKRSDGFDTKAGRNSLFMALDWYLVYCIVTNMKPDTKNKMKKYFEEEEIRRLDREIPFSRKGNIECEGSAANRYMFTANDNDKVRKRVIRKIIYDSERREKCKCIIDYLHLRFPENGMLTECGAKVSVATQDFRVELQCRRVEGDKDVVWKVAKAYGPELLSEINGEHHTLYNGYPESSPKLLTEIKNDDKKKSFADKYTVSIF